MADWAGGVRLVAGACSFATTFAHADTMRGALTQAYQNNPQLHAQRAAVRATDETVPQALSGYRPRISLSASAGQAFINSTFRATGAQW